MTTTPMGVKIQVITKQFDKITLSHFKRILSMFKTMEKRGELASVAFDVEEYNGFNAHSSQMMSLYRGKVEYVIVRK